VTVCVCVVCACAHECVCSMVCMSVVRECLSVGMTA